MPNDADAMLTDASSLTARYRPRPDRFDMLLDRRGALRPPWPAVVAELAREGEGGRERIAKQAERLLYENGVTFHLQDDPAQADRPWPYDVVPLAIGQKEWQELETGLAQRARLLNTLLNDLYGPQHALRSGVLPRAMVFANPEFLRACHGVPVPEALRLPLYAADLCRAADGRWLVMADRTQAPGGMGYALENRIVASLTQTEALRACKVTRLAGFFRAMRTTLFRLAGRPDPRIVLLSGGPSDPAYFEHAYLARYLGCVLAEGGDLTVRERRVFLKALDGVKPVDLILRRIDGSLTDPLDMSLHSTLGVPGMMQAVRAGTVVVANAIGSGLVEADAFAPYMPALCRLLLGEDLQLDSPGAHWCGDPRSRAVVQDRPDDFVIRPTFPSLATPPERLDRRGRERLLARMAREPGNFVARERPALPVAPVLAEGGLAPGSVSLRVFATAVAGGAYAVMPGGLARVVNDDAAWPIAMHGGVAAKDVWIIGDRPPEYATLLSEGRGEDGPVIRLGADIPSRAADNLYWLGRYAERSESSVRLLRSVLVRLTEGRGADLPPQRLRLLLRSLVPADRGDRRSRDPMTDLEALLDRLFTDAARMGSVPHGLDLLGRAAATVRERLSVDALRTLRRLRESTWHGVGGRRQAFESRLAFLDDLIQGLAAFAGMVQENMTRSPAWHMLDIGRRQERIHLAIGSLRRAVRTAEPDRDGTLDWLLELADSTMTYRTRYLAPPRLARTLDLLILDATNPRSVAFQLDALAAHLDHLPKVRGDVVGGDLLLNARELLSRADLAALCRLGANGRRAEFGALLDGLGVRTRALSERLTRTYFRHLEPARPTATRVLGGSGAL